MHEAHGHRGQAQYEQHRVHDVLGLAALQQSVPHSVQEPRGLGLAAGDDDDDAQEKGRRDDGHVPEEELLGALESKVDREGGGKVVEEIPVGHEQRDASEDDGDDIGGAAKVEGDNVDCNDGNNDDKSVSLKNSN